MICDECFMEGFHKMGCSVRYEKYKMDQIDCDEISRVEVIDETGRGYIKYLEDDESVRLELQDDNRTLKVFIDNLKSK